MPTYLTQRRALVIVAAVLLLSSLAPVRVSSKLAYLPGSIVSFTTQPFTQGLRWLATTLRPPTERELDLSDAETRQLYGEALSLIRRLEYKLAAAEQQIALLTQSRTIALSGVQLVDASVTGYSGERLNPVLSINRGRAGGIYPGAPVVSGFNLVGRVTEAYPASADVGLVNAPGATLLVRILPPTPEAGPREVKEMIHLTEGGEMWEVSVAKGQPVREGDIAQLSDPSWPPEAQGYLIGQVVEVEPDPQNPLNAKRVRIRPMAPLTELSRVTVLVPAE